MLNVTFIRYISQSAPDLTKKMQKVEGAMGMKILNLIDIAIKVWKNGEVEEVEG